MAVSEQTPYIEYIGNGVTTSFALEFDCSDKNHLIVLVDDLEPEVGSWSLSDGAVVFGTAPENNKKISIKRNTPFRRDSDFQSYDNSFRPKPVNTDFDRVWWKIQELGVADWILGARIDALKNYVDRKDDELKAYLMEEIRKQGVALDQLEDYYNYLMERLAQIAVDKGWDSSFVVHKGKTQYEVNEEVLSHNTQYDNQFLLIEKYKLTSDEYIDDALDAIKNELISKGSMSGGTLMIPRGIWRVKRSHDLSVTGLRMGGGGGRYASRIVVDVDGEYSAGYVFKIAPTSGQSITGGSGLEKITIDLNEAPAIGLIYQGAYDVSAFDRAELINGHKDFPCAVIEPTPTGTVIQTLKLDTAGFSKKVVGGTGYVVEVRKAQECLIINSKMFGSPSNSATKGSIPLLLEDVRGIQIIGGGFANSETNCIHIHAKTRSCTHVSIIGPTFEGFKAKAIKTWGDYSVADPIVTNKVSRLIIMNERLITPSAGLLDASDLTFSTIYASNAEVELKSGCTNNTIHTYDKSKVIDNGTYNEVVESPSTLNSNKHVSTRQQSIKLASTPALHLEVEGKTAGYRFQWTASATTDTGAAIHTPNGSMPIRFLDDRLGFFGIAPVGQRISPLSSATDTQKIAAVILGLEQLGFFKQTT